MHINIYTNRYMYVRVFNRIPYAVKSSQILAIDLANVGTHIEMLLLHNISFQNYLRLATTTTLIGCMIFS